MDETVKALLDKAKTAERAYDAVQFAQAALNAANALRVLSDIPTKK